MSVARIEPPYVADERPMLEAWLEYHRATLAMKCDGLSAEQLRLRAVPPSDLSLLGLVRHMAEVERSWFRRTLSDEDALPLYYSDADPDEEQGRRHISDVARMNREPGEPDHRGEEQSEAAAVARVLHD